MTRITPPVDTASSATIETARAIAAEATKVPKWQASTAYTAGDVVMSPDGSIVKRLADGTSGVSYTSTNWQTVATVAGTQANTELNNAIVSREKAPKLYYLKSYSTFFPDPAWVYVLGQGNTATTLTVVANSGDTTLTVADPTGLSANVVLILNAGTSTQQIRRIASVAGSVLTLTTALTSGVTNGAAVTPLWTDDRHLTNAGYDAFGYFIANAQESGSYIITGTAPKVTFLGNSWFFRGGTSWATQINARIPGATIVNAGVSGNKSDQLLARFDTDVPSDSTYVVINEPGVNDDANGYSAATQAANLEAIWRKCQAIGAILVYTGHVPLQPFPQVASDRAASMLALIGDGSSFPEVTATGVGALTGTASLPFKVANTNSLGIGSSALLAVTSATTTTAIGYNAGLALTTGGTNTTVGYASLSTATTASANTAVGALALRNATSNNNTAVGYNSLFAVSSGANNTGVGWFAGAKITTAQTNVAIGYAALSENLTSDSNTAVGALALHLATSTSNTAVGYNAGATLSTGTGTAMGYSALAAADTATGNSAFGILALRFATSNNNSAFGASALAAVTTGANNSGFGYNAGLLLDGGQGNSAFGYTALAANVSGSFNAAFGGLSLRNATGDKNSAFGYNALAATNSGTANVAVGYNAGTAITTSSSNTALGYASLATASTAGFNTAVGSLALTLATGANNTALGYNAGTAVSTGAGNIHIGYEAAHLVAGAASTDQTTTSSNQVVVGRQAGGTGDYIVTVGYFTKATAAGAVAIGTDSTGAGATTSTANEFVLGTANHTVKTPGKHTTAASTTSKAGLNVPAGAAPSAPVDGDMWTTTAGMFVRINGVTKTVTLT